MKSFTQSAAAINAYEEVINENGPDETRHMWNICEAETIKSTLFYVALLVYLAKATNFVLFLDKVWCKIKKGIVTHHAVLVSGWDTPVCQRRATLVSVVDTPIHQRTHQQPTLENNIIAKMKWSENDNLIVSKSFLEGKDYRITSKLLPHLKERSIFMKYKNCLYLQQGNVKGSLKNVSKQHQEVWKKLALEYLTRE